MPAIESRFGAVVHLRAGAILMIAICGCFDGGKADSQADAGETVCEKIEGEYRALVEESQFCSSNSDCGAPKSLSNAMCLFQGCPLAFNRIVNFKLIEQRATELSKRYEHQCNGYPSPCSRLSNCESADQYQASCDSTAHRCVIVRRAYE